MYFVKKKLIRYKQMKLSISPYLQPIIFILKRGHIALQCWSLLPLVIQPNLIVHMQFQSSKYIHLYNIFVA